MTPDSAAAFAPSGTPSSRALAAADVRIAVLIPCYNEATTIADVVRDFAAALPGAAVWVFDNNSTDDTSAAARAAGARVRRAPFQGKGSTVRQMFADVEADAYVLVDGDATYDAAAAPAMVAHLVENGLDMINGARVEQESAAYRPGHRFGNLMLTGLVRRIFGRQFKDMLSGYRVFSRRFVKSFPAASKGFEIETELTVHALQMRLPCDEVDTAYGARPEGSESKLSTIRDGLRILRMIGLLVREERPLQFFTAVAVLAFAWATLLSVPLAMFYLRHHLVPRVPTLIVAVGLVGVGVLSFACGLILDTVSRARLEQRRLAYLAIPGPDAARFRRP